MSLLSVIMSTLSEICSKLEMFFITPIFPPKLSPYVESLDVQGNRVLVTGSNAGIGKEIARYFAARGAEVFLLCRSEAKAFVTRDELRSSTGNPKVFVEVIDMSSLESVRGFLSRWTERSPDERKVDILMNNAGIPPSSHKVTTPDGFELVYQVNFLAHFLLTSTLLKLGLFSSDARIVQTASLGMYGSGKLNPADPNSLDLLGKVQEGALLPMSSATALYGRSKAAQVVWTQELPERLAKTEMWKGVIVQSCNPGWVSTDIWHKPEGLMSYPSVYRVASFVDKLVGRTASQGAVVPIYLAVSPEAAEPVVRGCYWDLRRRWTPAWMEDGQLRKQLRIKWEQDADIDASF